MAYRHTQEQALDKCNIKITPHLEIKYKLLVKTGYAMTPAQAVLAVCTEAVKDVELSERELNAIRDEMKANYDKRMAARAAVAAYNRTRPGGKFRRDKVR